MALSRGGRLALGSLALLVLVGAAFFGIRSLVRGSGESGVRSDGAEEADDGGESPADGAAAEHATGLDPEELDRLRSLGYAGSVPAATDHRPSGVTIRTEAMQPGYSFFTNTHLCSAALIDESGKIENFWSMDDCIRWAHAKLLDSGDLLVVGREPPRPKGDAGAPSEAEDPSYSRFLARVAWTGEILWKRAIPAHHDMELLPDGRILLLTIDHTSIPAISPDVPVRDNRIVLLSREGEEIESVSLYELYSASPSVARLQPVKPGRSGRIDLFHANSIATIGADHPGVAFLREEAREGRSGMLSFAYVLVSTRHQDTIFLVDWARRRVVWAWGQGELSGPHDASMLPNGNILLFDNGLARGWSRVVELDPARRRIVWSFEAPGRKGFFSLSRGSSQRLPNGNTLIMESDRARALEVTSQGEIVWEFVTPFRNAEGERATMTRIVRHDREAIQAIVRSRGEGRKQADITPK